MIHPTHWYWSWVDGLTTDLRVVLISPAGTRSVLAVPHGDHNANYVGWTFTSVRHWDENSAGKWRLLISDEFSGAVGLFSYLYQRICLLFLLVDHFLYLLQANSTAPLSPCVGTDGVDTILM